jgi:hypothetical protein
MASGKGRLIIQGERPTGIARDTGITVAGIDSSAAFAEGPSRIAKLDIAHANATAVHLGELSLIQIMASTA